MRVAGAGESVRDGRERERLRLDQRDLVPGKRRRYARIRRRAHGICRGDRPVLRVLVVVDEHAVPLLLPPLAGGEGRRAPLHLPREGQGRRANFLEHPAPLDANVHVHAPRAGRLRPTGETVLAQDLAREHGHLPHLGPGHAGHRIEIDAQLVGMIEVVRAHRVRVEIDATEVDDPGELGRVAQHHFAGGAPGGELQLHGLDPEWPRLRGPLLEEENALRAVHVPLQRHRPATRPTQRAPGDRQVIADQIELRVSALREEDLLRIRDGDLASLDLEELLASRHRRSIAPTNQETPKICLSSAGAVSSS